MSSLERLCSSREASRISFSFLFHFLSGSEEEVLHHLLGDGAGAEALAAAERVDRRRPQQREEVEPGVLVEVLVLGADHRLDEHPRDPVHPHHGAPLPKNVAHHGSVRGDHLARHERVIVAHGIERGDLAPDVDVPADQRQDPDGKEERRRDRRSPQPHLPARRAGRHMALGSPRPERAGTARFPLGFGDRNGLGLRRRFGRLEDGGCRREDCRESGPGLARTGTSHHAPRRPFFSSGGGGAGLVGGRLARVLRREGKPGRPCAARARRRCGAWAGAARAPCDRRARRPSLPAPRPAGPGAASSLLIRVLPATSDWRLGIGGCEACIRRRLFVHVNAGLTPGIRPVLVEARQRPALP